VQMVTMPAILCDHDVEGQLKVLLSIWTSSDWIELWKMLDCHIHTFPGLDLPIATPDSDLWQLCQVRQFILLTGNRNADDEDSLEKTIRRLSQPDSLPVITLADAKRVMLDRNYAERVAGQIVEIIYDVEMARGTRRLFVP
jgi:hypothetical protein